MGVGTKGRRWDCRRDGGRTPPAKVSIESVRAHLPLFAQAQGADLPTRLDVGLLVESIKARPFS